MAPYDGYADQLNIETPEQVDLRFPVAGMGSRLLAVLTDTLLQGAVYVIFLIVIYATSAYAPAGKALDHRSPAAQKWLAALFILLNFVMIWGYFALFEAYWHGQTPGKRLLRLRVLKDSGRAITLFESMARNLLRVVDSLPGMYLVGVISMLCNRENKRLGDLVAGTIVVHERVDEQPLLAHSSRSLTLNSPAQRFLPAAQQAWAAGEAVLPADAVTRLRPADLHVIETFFSRALDLSLEKRAELGARVAAQMTARMGITLPAEVDPERALELIAWRMRR